MKQEAKEKATKKDVAEDNLKKLNKENPYVAKKVETNNQVKQMISPLKKASFKGSQYEFIIPQNSIRGNYNDYDAKSNHSIIISPDKDNFMASIGNFYTSQKVNNISPDQPVQFNFANKPNPFYNSSASGQQNSANENGFNTIL